MIVPSQNIDKNKEENMLNLYFCLFFQFFMQ